jgi:hypothetical protein
LTVTFTRQNPPLNLDPFRPKMLQCRQLWGADGEVQQTPQAQITNGALSSTPAAFNLLATGLSEWLVV